MTDQTAETTPRSPHRVATTLRRLARRLDDLPISPTSIGDRLWDIHYDRRQRRATTDPEWAAIEARRGEPGSKFKTLLSDDLTWADWETQTEIADRLTPAPRWMPAARLLSRMRATTATSSVVDASQRVIRGWADADTWNLGGRLCQVLGAELQYLAAIASGWPSGEKYPTYEDWTAALNEHGRALSAYAEDSDIEQAQSDAKAALHWVADNLGHLWD